MQIQDEILKKIKQFARRQKWINVISSMILLFNISLGYYLICSILDIFIHFQWNTIKTASFTFYTVLSLFFTGIVLIPFLVPISLSKTAVKIEAFFNL